MNFLARALAVAAAAVLLAAPQASALTQNCVTKNGKKTISYTLDAASLAKCNAAGAENDSVAAISALFGGTDWILADKKKDNGSDDGGAGGLLFTNAIVDFESPRAWRITDPSSVADLVVIVLKQSTTFAAFLLDTSAATASGLGGTWSVGGDTTANDISHSSLYYTPAGSVVEPIPLPAGVLLILSALAGAAVVSRAGRGTA